MSRLLLAIFFSVFYCFLLVGVYSGVNARPGEAEPIQWWATPWPQNRKLIEVKVVGKDGYCVEPALPFNVDYFDRSGKRRDVLRGEFSVKESRMCAGTYTLYYKVDYPAASTSGGQMYWTLIDQPRQKPRDLL
jgi:hypothetical protein